MPSLLEIERSINDLLNSLDDTLATAETEEERAQIEAGLSQMLDELAAEESDKIDAYGAILNRLETESERLSGIIEGLTERKRSISARADRLKKHALDVFDFTGRKKIEGRVYIAKVRTSESIDAFEPDSIPEELCRVTVKRDPDKKAIKEAIKAGQNVRGAVIVEKTSISIGCR